MTRALLYCAGGGIGDSLVASVVARALHARFSVVDALTLPHHRSTLERVPDVDVVLTDDGGDERALAAELQARDYDACVVTWATARTARVAQLAKIPVRVGQSGRLYSYRFTDRVAVRSERGDVLSHWSDILLDFARALDCDAPDRAYRFIPTQQDEAEAAVILSEAPQPNSVILSEAPQARSRRTNGNLNFLILNPCNAIASKRGIWPIEGWAALARALQQRFDATIFVSGSPADAPICEAIAEAAMRPSTARFARARDDNAGAAMRGEVVSVAGKLGIGAFGALAARARGFVGITTGSMHVAAAVGCPTVGIFPFQSDFPERWAPLGLRTAVVRPSFACHRGDTKENCVDYACIAHLDVERALAAAGALLSRPREALR
ncbi:MAG TPA: glycosyltransferase family 9 protein [Candidatus Baltobacteraceae bacterium]|nr:glycosyltransferase family 9 protein [Candidatus Baltobacteraceae bacterium]